MERVQDINIKDNIFKKNYSNEFNNNNYDSAFSILENEDLHSKSFIAEIINNISDILYSIEEDYYSNTENYLYDLNEDFQNTISNLKYCGIWDYSIVYKKYNIVKYNNNYYLYKSDSIGVGIFPTETSYWLRFNLNGAKGADGIGVNFKGNWDSSVSYNALDGVYYNGAIWCCKTANSNKTPNSSSTYWESVVTFLKAKIISGTTEPSDKYNGLIWIEILS